MIWTGSSSGSPASKSETPGEIPPERIGALMKPGEFAKPFRVADGSHFRLKDSKPADTLGLKSKEHAKETLERGIVRLSKLQEKLYAQDRWGILLILQAMDAAGKDSTIKHVMSGINPQGCQVNSFKSPSDEELQHDFCGEPRVRSRNAARLAFSTGRIMRKSWPSAYIRISSPARKFLRSWCWTIFGRSASKTSMRSNDICRETGSWC